METEVKTTSGPDLRFHVTKRAEGYLRIRMENPQTGSSGYFTNQNGADGALCEHGLNSAGLVLGAMFALVRLDASGHPVNPQTQAMKDALGGPAKVGKDAKVKSGDDPSQG